MPALRCCRAASRPCCSTSLQDLDEAALLVLRHLARGNGRFIGVGDFNQHILPGASSIFGDSAQRILQELPAGTGQATLNTTYRFGPSSARN